MHDPGPESSEPLPPPSDEDEAVFVQAVGVVLPATVIAYLASGLGLTSIKSPAEIIAAANLLDIVGRVSFGGIGRWLNKRRLGEI